MGALQVLVLCPAAEFVIYICVTVSFVQVLASSAFPGQGTTDGFLCVALPLLVRSKPQCHNAKLAPIK
jgi:hypothetical protein